MEPYKVTMIEHPFVRRVKAMLARPLSPVLTVRDSFQPSHGSLKRTIGYMSQNQESIAECIAD